MSVSFASLPLPLPFPPSPSLSLSLSHSQSLSASQGNFLLSSPDSLLAPLRLLWSTWEYFVRLNCASSTVNIGLFFFSFSFFKLESFVDSIRQYLFYNLSYLFSLSSKFFFSLLAFPGKKGLEPLPTSSRRGFFGLHNVPFHSRSLPLSASVSLPLPRPSTRNCSPPPSAFHLCDIMEWQPQDDPLRQLACCLKDSLNPYDRPLQKQAEQVCPCCRFSPLSCSALFPYFEFFL